MKSLAEHGSMKQPWFVPANPRREQDRWVTNLNEDRKSFFLIASLLDPRTKSLSFCDDKHFPTSWKREGHGFLAKTFTERYRILR
jgi:hypothetical protein